MALWCDKYRPSSLAELDYHEDQAKNIRNLIEKGDFPHLFLYGPSGAGKKTRIECILRELFGKSVDRRRTELHTVTTPSNKKIEIRTIATNCHIEVTPSDAGIYDRLVIQDLIKSVASTRVLNAEKASFNVVVINDADRLTKDAQHGLRRTMEKYMNTCRLILCGESTNRTIPAIQSRCLMLRVAAPTIGQMIKILKKVARDEEFALSEDAARAIAVESERNLRRALLIAETMKATGSKDPVKPDWKEYLDQTADLIQSQQSIKRATEVRTRLYELQLRLIPEDVIFKHLVNKLVNKCPDRLRGKIIEYAAHYEHKMRLGSKSIFHMEAFIVRCMAAYAKFLTENIIIDDEDLIE